MELLEQQLIDFIGELGPDHSDTLAARMFDETANGFGPPLGPGHIETLTALNNSASAPIEAGRAEQARVILDRTLADADSSLGAGDPLTRVVLRNARYAREVVQ